jgi:NTE family protein
MRFSDVARWRLSTRGLVGSDPMTQFLAKVLKVFEFEKMKIPLAVIASDLNAGAPAVFRDKGDVVLPIRASCSYPGLFQPVRYLNHCLVDGMISMDVPAAPLRRMGATHVISVALPMPTETFDPQNMLSVVTRCFQIMNARTESQWRRHSNLVITPDVKDIGWNSFESAGHLVEAGEKAARQVLPQILRWFTDPPKEGGEAVAVA